MAAVLKYITLYKGQKTPKLERLGSTNHAKHTYYVHLGYNNVLNNWTIPNNVLKTQYLGNDIKNICGVYILSLKIEKLITMLL